MKDYHTMMESTAKGLNAAAPKLRKMIEQARQAADEACAAGDAELSKDLRMMESHLNMAYAIGRGLKDKDGGIIVMGGGK